MNLTEQVARKIRMALGNSTFTEAGFDMLGKSGKEMYMRAAKACY